MRRRQNAKAEKPIHQTTSYQFESARHAANLFAFPDCEAARLRESKNVLSR
jgi:O-acetylhomoserine/O-acetylserine sulfhydrylase-like pyridoxal-dependent enzyme